MYIDTDIDMNLDHEPESTCSIGKRISGAVNNLRSFFEKKTHWKCFESMSNQINQILNSGDPQEGDLKLSRDKTEQLEPA